MRAEALFQRPIAHRALHDLAAGRPENSLSAVKAAVAAGYGIEVDIQPSTDGVPMVFHDYDLTRLTGQTGDVRNLPAAELTAMPLTGSTNTVPRLADVLNYVDGKVPLIIEVKDQDGAIGPNVGPLEDAVARTLHCYDGPVAVMSFNPHSVAAIRDAAPNVPRGLVTCAWSQDDWPNVPDARRADLRQIGAVAALDCAFISHDARDLASSHVAAVKAQGLTILCWTIRSPMAEKEARQVADQVTFERYLA